MAMDEMGLRLWIYLLMGGVLLGGVLKKLLAWQATLAGWLGAGATGAGTAAAALWVRLPTLLLLLALLLTLLLLLLFVLPGSSCQRPAALPAQGKAVLITGCDSGFGRAAARALDAAGMEVFATVLDLSGEGARELRVGCSPRLTLLQVDITQPQQVQQALTEVQARLGTRGLWGLVNNAGVCVNFGDTELSLMSNFRGCMEVNFFGTLNVTKSFLPMLRQAKGRIVNVSSPAGDQPFPCLAAYGASKAALNLLTDTLRHEMEPWGVQVSTILPSSYKTGQASNAAYWERQHQQLLQSLPPALLDEYGCDYVTETKELFQRHARKAQPDLRPVVDAIAEALLTPRPHHRYLVGPGVGLMYFIHTYCPFSLSNRFLQRLFVDKKLLPRALRRRSVAAAAVPTDCQLALLLNNNNDGEDKLK